MFDIVIPTYRIDPELLDKCLDSVSKQTFTDYTVWIVDGTPPDSDTYQDCLDVIAKYPDFNWFTQVEQGVSHARNEAAAKGSHPFIAWLDADDYWYSEHLAEIMSCIDKSIEDHVLYYNAGDVRLSMVGCKSEYTSLKTMNYYDTHNKWHPRYHGMRWRKYATLFPSTAVCRRTRFEEVGGWPTDMWLGEDTVLWYLMCGDGRVDEKVYLSYQNDFVGGFRLHEVNYLDKGQNPFEDLYGIEGRNQAKDQMEAGFLKYFGAPWGMEDQPADMSKEEWAEIVDGRPFFFNYIVNE